MAEKKEDLAPIQKTVDVECPVEDAFELFTQRFSDWWPHDDDGSRSVIAWEPPTRVAFKWDNDEVVNVEFETIAIGTRVTVTHTGWHRSAAEVCTAFREFACSQLVLA